MIFWVYPYISPNFTKYGLNLMFVQGNMHDKISGKESLQIFLFSYIENDFLAILLQNFSFKRQSNEK